MSYKKPKPGEWVQPVSRGYKMACCDCGLVHTMDFRIYDDRVQFRAFRNERSTAAMRREDRKRGGVYMKTDRSTCTKDAPMPKGDNGYWQHPDAKDVGEEINGLSGGGDYDIYECPNCGLRFYVTVPD